MIKDGKILVGKNSKKEIYLLPSMAQRHGLITGASGSGKTVTSKLLAEGFSDLGVPVFMADVKGDLGGCAVPGEMNENVSGRVKDLKLNDFEVKSYPVRFWDVFGVRGHSVRASISSIGPDILSIMLGLSEAQEGVLDIVFKIAEDEKLDIVNMADLRSLLQCVGDNRADYITKYGNITTQSVGVIQRSLLALENQGADKFFGEPELDIVDFIKTDASGKGFINILDAVELFKSPDLFTSFLLWLLNTLFNTLPEVGDLDKPRIVFFFDEAHLLFNGMPSYRLKRITQVVKLIRSKGIGLYFLSQNPTDIPDEIIGQLGNRVQHTLRAYTPAEQKVVKTAADAFRTNPEFKTMDAILALGKGEALVSFQNEKGEPEIVEKVTILPPQSSMGTIDDITRNKIINSSELVGKYDEAIDNESAYEKISAQNEEKKAKAEELLRQKEEEKRLKEEEKKAKEEEKERLRQEKEAERKAKEEARQKEKEAREKERKRKSSEAYKMGQKVKNRTSSFLLTKLLNSLWKSIFKK